MNRTRTLLIPLALAASLATADSIILNGEQIDGVYIVESSRAYYICNPADGTAHSVAKTDPALGKVTISADEAAREAWRAEYDARKTARDYERLGVQERPLETEAEFVPEMGSTHPTPIPARTETPVLALRGEPGSASRLGANSPNSFTSQQNAGGMGGGGGGLGGGVSGGGTVSPGGGFGGGGGAGGGAGGGGAGRGGGTGFGFTNISELFSTIDDAEVGETPNPITGR